MTKSFPKAGTDENWVSRIVVLEADNRFFVAGHYANYEYGLEQLPTRQDAEALKDALDDFVARQPQMRARINELMLEVRRLRSVAAPSSSDTSQP